MKTSSQRSQFEILASIAKQMETDYPTDSVAWKESPFLWLKSQPSRRKGMIAEVLVQEWVKANGLSVDHSPDSDADRLISGIRVEIKSSFLWKGGSYKFQQLRDQNYSIVICLGLSPMSAHCWSLPKDKIIEAWHRKYQGIGSQHGGHSGVDTAWLSVDPSRIPSWLRPYGGTLGEGLNSLLRLLR